jgi:hypothetical protein
MTLTSDLIAISSVSVGGGTAYPVIRSRVTTRYEGPEGQSSAAYRVETWELTCHAFAGGATGIAALSESIRDDLCKRGEAVTLTQWAGTRSLPAAGGSSGSQAGYPIVELADEPDRCFGNVLTFGLRCETRIPQPATGVVEHSWERTEETDEDGKISITQRGTYRVANNGDAQDEAQNDIIDLAAAAAAAANMTFRVRWTLGPDAAVAGYEYTMADKEFSGVVGVDEAQLTDRTAKNNEGRIVRTISGYAAGLGAEAWIATQAPVLDATMILVRRETSPATIPDGRINFVWEVLTGVVDPQFPGIVIFGFEETLEEQESVAVLTAASYLAHDPVLRYAERRPHVYVQRTRVDFIGDWAAGSAAITGLYDDSRLIDVPRRVLRAGPHGIKTYEYTASYMYVDPPAILPDPREVPALT